MQNKDKLATTRESVQLWEKSYKNFRIGIEYEPKFVGLGGYGEKKKIANASKSEKYKDMYHIVLLLFVLEINLSIKVGKANEHTSEEKGVQKKRAKSG